MKFGQVADPSGIDFTIPQTPQASLDLLGHSKSGPPLEVYVGCAKWNRKDLKGFYPRGIRDELVYYATQFNSIELNATFYNSPSKSQVETWKEKTPEGFSRYVGANHPSDYTRLDDWISTIVEWKEAGLQKLYFFIHQNIEEESPLLATHFIGKLNEAIGTKLNIPARPDGPGSGTASTLF